MSFNPQIIGVGETKWSGNGVFFATADEALAYAAALQGRWMGCKGGSENRRAFESDEPVNYQWVDGQLVSVVTDRILL